MKTLYRKIISVLTDEKSGTIYNEFEVKKTTLVDEYEGQYLYQENQELLNCPFVLVEYDIEYKTPTEPATITLALHLGYEQIKRANNTTPSLNKHLKFFNYTDAVHKIINGLETNFTGKLELVSENSLKEPAITKVHTLTYQCSYTGRNSNIEDKFCFTTSENATLKTEGIIKKKYDFTT